MNLDKLTLLFASIAFIFILTFGPHTPVARKGINPELRSYVNEFIDNAKIFRPDFKFPNINIDIQDLSIIDPFGDPHYKIAGVCNMVTGNLMIDSYMISHLSHDEIEQIVWHELGHCVLHRGHEERIYKGNPISIMYPYVLDRDTYMHDRVYYIMELFLGSRVWPKMK